MATIGNTFPTLFDVVKRLDPQGSVAQIAEVLTRYLPMLEDMTWAEGNLPTGHRFTSRTGLPTLTWRRFNQGLDPVKSTTDQFDEVVGMLEGYSKVDVDLAKLNGNEAAFRLSEDKAFIQGMNIQVANALMYASVVATPEQITGFTPRLNQITGNVDPSVNQIVNCSGVSANVQTSIWLVGWSPETVFGIFPKGSVGGIQTEDLGRQLVLDANNKQFLAYVTRWQWKLGLCVKDYRFVVRACNIDTGTLTSTFTSGTFGSGADLAMRMLDMIAKMYNIDTVRPVFYMNRAAFSMLNKQLVARQANWLEWLDGSESGTPGKRIPSFFGIPIKYVDSILNTEAVVS
jgi:hypothetical protein